MEQTVTLTEVAAFQVKEMLEQNGEQGHCLRVAVHGGGCTGLTYGLSTEERPADGDERTEQHGVIVLVKSEDAPILRGTVVDFKQSLMGGGFTIDNPNAIASCGCGASFRTASKTGTPGAC